MTAIIILNWNGADDTIECLESLYAAQGQFFVVLADNGSADDSVSRIQTWAVTHSVHHRRVERGSVIATPPENRDLIVVPMRENLGFARGNNAALECLKPVTPDYVLLLNNDTLVEPDFLIRLTDFMQEHPHYVALTPQIRYNAEREMIWNCGGKLTWGSRKYFYARQNYKQLPRVTHLDVTFATGCALLFNPSLLNQHHHIFTEDFFFGEEDYNLCSRLLRENKKMACVLDALIYHKVNASITKVNNLGRIYIATLNRAIDMRQLHGGIQSWGWLVCFTIYTTCWMLKSGFTFSAIFRMFSSVWHQMLKGKCSVTKQDFEQARDF